MASSSNTKPVDEDLNQLERSIRQLKIEYEQYFGGGRSRPPTDTEWRAEQIVKRYDGRVAEINSAQRFRFSNLTQTLAKYREIWRKKLRAREEGRIQRHFGAAARQIEAERARARAAEAGESDEAASPKREKKRNGREGPFKIVCTDPQAESEKVEKLYAALVQAHESAGQNKGVPSLGDFRAFVAKKTGELRKANKDAQVEYVVAVDGGKVKLSAKVKS